MTDDLLETPEVEPKNYLEELVGEGKKFKDVEALAKGKWESDRYIPLKNKQFDSLSADYLKLREEAQTRARLEDLLSQLEDKQLASSKLPTAKEEPRELPTYNPTDIEDLVSKKITENERARQRQANLNVVRAKLTEQFGDAYAPAVRERITALGLSEQDFSDWSAKSPAAVINALGLNETRSSGDTAPPRSNRTFKPVTEQKRTWSYYQELRKTNPKLYADPKILNQMLADAEALGTAFEDGDFHTR